MTLWNIVRKILPFIVVSPLKTSSRKKKFNNLKKEFMVSLKSTETRTSQLCFLHIGRALNLRVTYFTPLNYCLITATSKTYSEK